MRLIKPRDYQKDAVKALINGGDGSLVVAPTGAGKSIIAAEFCRKMSLKGKLGCVIVPTRELVVQNHVKLEALGVETGIFCSGLGKKQVGRTVTVCSIQSLYKAKGQVKENLMNFDYFLVDEAHRIGKQSKGMFHHVLRVENKNKPVYGLTATPYRLDCGELVGEDDSTFSEIVYDIEISTLIERGYLVLLKNVVIKDRVEEIDGVPAGRDYTTKEQESVTIFDKITKSVINDIKRLMRVKRQRILVFACSLKHIRYLEGEFKKAGLTKFGSVHSKMNKTTRDNTINRFKRGQDKILIGRDIFIEGFDVPEVNAIVCLRPTQSRARYIQMLGRGARPAKGKEDCLILDYANNISRHGPFDLPTQEVFDLLAMQKQVKVQIKAENKIFKDVCTNVAQCKSCEMFMDTSKLFCLHCGAPTFSVRHKDNYDVVSTLMYESSQQTAITSEVYSIVAEILPESATKTITFKFAYYTEHGKVTEYFHPFLNTASWTNQKTLTGYKRVSLIIGEEYDIKNSATIKQIELFNKLKAILSQVSRIAYTKKGKYFRIDSYE